MRTFALGLVVGAVVGAVTLAALAGKGLAELDELSARLLRKAGEVDQLASSLLEQARRAR